MFEQKFLLLTEIAHFKLLLMLVLQRHFHQLEFLLELGANDLTFPARSVEPQRLPSFSAFVFPHQRVRRVVQEQNQDEIENWKREHEQRDFEEAEVSSGDEDHERASAQEQHEVRSESPSNVVLGNLRDVKRDRSQSSAAGQPCDDSRRVQVMNVRRTQHQQPEGAVRDHQQQQSLLHAEPRRHSSEQNRPEKSSDADHRADPRDFFIARRPGF